MITARAAVAARKRCAARSGQVVVLRSTRSAGRIFARVGYVGGGFQRQRWRAGRRFVFALGLNHRAHAAFRIAGRGGLLAAADDAEKLGRRIVGNVVAAHVVVAFLEVGAIEHLQLFIFAVILDALGIAFDIFVIALALLAEAREIAVSRAAFEAVGVLLHDHPVAADHQRALRQYDVALESRDLLGVVHRYAVGLEVDRLVAVGAFGVRRRNRVQTQREQREVA